MNPPTPRIAVLGGGPIGLEAALTARSLGYPVSLYERGETAGNVRDWGHVHLFTPWSLNVSGLGERRLMETGHLAQPLSGSSDCPRGTEFREQYLIPLSRLPEMNGVIREHTRVIAVGRAGLLKGDMKGRAEEPFRLLLETPNGETTATADVIVDATGTYGNPTWLGAAGIPAPGERALADHIVTGLPDVPGALRSRVEGRQVLVVGGGFSAATTVCALLELDETTVRWATRAGSPPLEEIPGDPLPTRLELTRRANALAAGADPRLQHIPFSTVTSLEPGADREVRVTLESPSGPRTLTVDVVVNQTGFRPDRDLHRELQIHECYASEGPMKLSAALLGAGEGDCMTQEGFGPETLVNPEPGYFIVGQKSYGRGARFLLRIGREQVRDVFRLVSGNRALDPDVPETLHAG